MALSYQGGKEGFAPSPVAIANRLDFAGGTSWTSLPHVETRSYGYLGIAGALGGLVDGYTNQMV